MRLDRYLSRRRIIDLKSRDLEEALVELINVSLPKGDSAQKSKMLKALLRREGNLGTWLGHGVALPHIQTDIPSRYIFAVGRCPGGIKHDGSPEYQEARLVFLLLAKEKDPQYLNILAALARIFKEPELTRGLREAPDLAAFQSRLGNAFGGLALEQKSLVATPFNRLLMTEATRVAKQARCSAVLVFGDTFAGGLDPAAGLPKFRSVLVTRAPAERHEDTEGLECVISVRSFSENRLSQLRSALFIGLARGIFKSTDRLCCLAGRPASNQFDTLVVLDVEREFQSVFTKKTDLIPAGVKVEVAERVLSIATELGVTGREGRPVGCIFVLGDSDRVNDLVKPLILNPFFGYSAVDRNILNPFMDETIKELSCIDGAFVIEGDGTVESAGSLLHVPPEFYGTLPSGLGTRHAAAAAVSRAADCLAIVVSSSNGQVTLFRRGVLIPLVERGE